MSEYEVHRARFFEYEPKAIQSMSYDDINKKIAISRSDSTIEIWCAKHEYLESVIVPTLDRQVEVVLWCQSQLLSAGLDGFIVLYDVARLTAKKLVPSIGGAIWCMTRNKSENKIAVGTEDGYVVLYEIQIDGVIFEKSFNKQDSRILSIAWHRDEEILATGGIDNIRVWNSETGQVLQRISVGRVDKNKETLVWCLVLTADFNIISGDSRGKVSVWNSELGTLIKSFQTHSVDVLCLCIDESEKNVYCSGIDPSIIQLEYIKVNETDNYHSWVKSQVFYQHTHDVRSILITNKKQLITAGVDAKIVIKNINDRNSSIRRYNSLPQKQVVEVCGDYVLLQYPTHLELWNMGYSGENISEKSDGDNMLMSRPPRKFLHLKSKNNFHIVCSSIGTQQSNSDTNMTELWLAYSDIHVIHIYKIQISPKQPSINVTKIDSLPLACGNRPAITMKFFTSSMNLKEQQLRLCYLTNKSCLQTLELVKDESGFMLQSTIQCIQQENLTDNRVYLMACKDNFIATADTDLNIVVWSIKTQQIVCVIPRLECMPTSLNFHPSKKLLLVSYANRNIIEFDFDLNEYSEWSRKNSKNFPKDWLKQYNKLLNCFYDSKDPNNIITYDEQYLAIIDKNIEMPTNNYSKIFQQQHAPIDSLLDLKKESNGKLNELEKEKNPAIRVTNKYKYILHVNQPSKGKLMIVELTPLSVSDKLPPSLKQKKFGT